MGGLGLKKICEIASLEYENLKYLANQPQSEILTRADDKIGKTIEKIKSERRADVIKIQMTNLFCF